MRKANRLGFTTVESLIYLATSRGCHHFKNILPTQIAPPCLPSLDQLSQDELVVLLLHGNNRNEPIAIRCAAQLLKSKFISPQRVATLAIQERCETPLKYIAQQGHRHDHDSVTFWRTILDSLAHRGGNPAVGVLPHPSRFMINPGIHRGIPQKTYWLKPQEDQSSPSS